MMEEMAHKVEEVLLVSLVLMVSTAPWAQLGNRACLGDEECLGEPDPQELPAWMEGMEEVSLSHRSFITHNNN